MCVHVCVYNMHVHGGQHQVSSLIVLHCNFFLMRQALSVSLKLGNSARLATSISPKDTSVPASLVL